MSDGGSGDDELFAAAWADIHADVEAAEFDAEAEAKD